MWFMLAAGARPKETKINLMDCICVCSEVEIICLCKFNSSPTKNERKRTINIAIAS